MTAQEIATLVTLGLLQKDPYEKGRWNAREMDVDAVVGKDHVKVVAVFDNTADETERYTVRYFRRMRLIVGWAYLPDVNIIWNGHEV